MRPGASKTRREFLQVAASAGAAAVLAGCAGMGGLGAGPAGGPNADVDVAPAEDLMREHGALIRVMLIYQECLRRAEADVEAAAMPGHPWAAMQESAQIIRHFVEDYHEKLEEEHVFPRVRGNAELAALADTLTAQHAAGRRVTDVVLRLTARGETPKTPDDRRKVQTAIRQFIRMYRPHLAREDTVLFPAFHIAVPPKEYDRLGDQFEARETQILGEKGFEHMVEKVAAIEKTLGIYELSQFTPRE